ncbi:hypothetical protein FRB96_005819 [Tulasnella sp. 330]|nr:hypothetical protein FRB96_005819 [Tulasnella sp. 330]
MYSSIKLSTLFAVLLCSPFALAAPVVEREVAPQGPLRLLARTVVARTDGPNLITRDVVPAGTNSTAMAKKPKTMAKGKMVKMHMGKHKGKTHSAANATDVSDTAALAAANCTDIATGDVSSNSTDVSDSANLAAANATDIMMGDISSNATDISNCTALSSANATSFVMDDSASNTTDVSDSAIANVTSVMMGDDTSNSTSIMMGDDTGNSTSVMMGDMTTNNTDISGSADLATANATSIMMADAANNTMDASTSADLVMSNSTSIANCTSTAALDTGSATATCASSIMDEENFGAVLVPPPGGDYCRTNGEEPTVTI